MLRWLVEVTPLYRSVDLIRGISIGAVGWLQLVDVLYLLGVSRRRPDGRRPPDGQAALQVRH